MPPCYHGAPSPKHLEDFGTQPQNKNFYIPKTATCGPLTTTVADACVNVSIKFAVRKMTLKQIKTMSQFQVNHIVSTHDPGL